MNVYAIFDSAASARLVGRIIEDPSLLLAAGEVESSAIMMAGGALRREHSPTVLVLDSDSVEERAILTEQAELEGIMSLYGSRLTYRVVLAVPQVEAILFSDREGFEKALGRKVGDEDWFEARFRPRAVLKRLLAGSDYEDALRKLGKALDDAAVQRMARHPIIQEIRDFMAEVQEPAAKRARVRRAG
jgi:hypothetical protein